MQNYLALLTEIATGATLALQLRTAGNQIFAVYWSVRTCHAHLHSTAADGTPHRRLHSFSRHDGDIGRVLQQLAAHSQPVQLGSVEISAHGFSRTTAALRPQLIAALAELLQLPPPDGAVLKAQQQARSAQRKAEREVRAQRKARLAERIERHRQQELAQRTPAQAVSDVASLLAALPIRLKDERRLAKALDMLKKEGFQLFHDVGEDAIAGVVRSQSDAELVYACRLGANGDVSCCTQKLNVCGGLRGEACKHVLVLLIGLAQAGLIEAPKVDLWLAAGLGRKPVLDREQMSEVLLRYRGAESGEVDWRPTTTLPEDFYAY